MAKTDAATTNAYDALKGKASEFEGAPEPIKKEDVGDRPFVITGWEMKDSDKYNKEPYMSVHIMFEDGTERSISDGSTGIMAQVKAMEDKGITAPVFCPKGLRYSEYENDKTGGRMVKTWYLA